MHAEGFGCIGIFLLPRLWHGRGAGEPVHPRHPAHDHSLAISSDMAIADDLYRELELYVFLLMLLLNVCFRISS